MIYVCNLEEMPLHARTLRPSHLVSLVPALDQPPTPPCVSPAQHLRIDVDDICEPVIGGTLPQAHHVASLIGFLRAWTRDAPLLVHCHAGISRSMAAAFIAVNLDAPGREEESARLLRASAPHANPNRRLVLLADELLERKGRLLSALAVMGPPQPVLAGPLVRLSPL